MSAAAAIAAVQAWLAPPSYTELQVLWERPQAGFPTLGPGRQPAPWVLAEMPFGSGITSPGRRGQRLRRKVGLLRAFVMTPRSMGAEAGMPYADRLDAMIDNASVEAGEPGRYVQFGNAAIVTGRDLLRLAGPAADSFDVVLVEATFTYFHR